MSEFLGGFHAADARLYAGSTPLPPPPSLLGGPAAIPLEVGQEVAGYLPHLSAMRTQLRETSAQIEDSVVQVCASFQAIAERARSTVANTQSLLGRGDGSREARQSFDQLIQGTEHTLVRILQSTAEAGEVSRRAMERVEQIDAASQQIGTALLRLEVIANENKMLALNARIEAAHAGAEGAGFAVVAVEVASQTQRSLQVTAEVSTLVENLRSLADSTRRDLQQLGERDQARIAQCRREVEASLGLLQEAHEEMQKAVEAMTEDGATLAQDIGSAVRGLQFQDRVAQRIGHVVEDLDTLRSCLQTHFGNLSAKAGPADRRFSAYTMREERAVAGMAEAESSAGDVELF